MNSRKITLAGALGTPLAARLDLPEGPVRGAALFAHCFTCSKDIAAARRIASPLAALSRPVDWPDLEGEILIRNGASESILAPGYRALAERATLMVRNVTSLVAMAEAGAGVTLLPALSTAHLPPGVHACDLAERGVQREVGLLERKGASRSPVAQAFLHLLLAEARERFAALNLEPVAT